VGDELQGAAVDCNSAEETHAWFDSRVAHHPRHGNRMFTRSKLRVSAVPSSSVMSTVTD
jgi:hypothetical protein